MARRPLRKLLRPGRRRDHTRHRDAEHGWAHGPATAAQAGAGRAHRDGVDADVGGSGTDVKALALGAADYIAKPQTSQIGGVDSYRVELLDKIVALGERAGGSSRARADYRLRPRPNHCAQAFRDGGCGVDRRACRAAGVSWPDLPPHRAAGADRAAHARDVSRRCWRRSCSRPSASRAARLFTKARP